MIDIKVTVQGLDRLTETMAMLASAMAYQQGMPERAKANISSLLEKAAEACEVSPQEEQKPVEVQTPEVKEEVNDIPMETVRKHVVGSKANKEKAKTVMTDMGVKKLTDLDQEQLNALYAALKED